MTDDEVLGGVNFASGGAGLLNETGIYFVSHGRRVPLLCSKRLPRHCMIAVRAMNVGGLAVFAGSVPVVRQPDIVVRGDQERHDRQDWQEVRRGGGQWRHLPSRPW